MGDFYIGLMSGTSADGIDAALVNFSAAQPRLIATCSTSYSTPLRHEILALLRTAGATQTDPIDALGLLDVSLGQAFADAALRLLEQAEVAPRDVNAIGSHGQTVRHRPDTKPAFTLQIGDPHVIAARTGITTVADFRRRDVAMGGHGAPLAPIFHRALFMDSEEIRTIVNIGGIANITILDTPVSGFDTGPGNTLMDAWSQRHFDVDYDKDGSQAGRGKVDDKLLAQLLTASYFKYAPPKRTGPETFNLAWLERVLAQRADRLKPTDVLATLCELTAATIIDAAQRYAPKTERLLICGGGAKNAHLMQRLAVRAEPAVVESTAAYGFEPDWIEAGAFAWLARETLAGRPGNLPAVTGARSRTILGAIHPAPLIQQAP